MKYKYTFTKENGARASTIASTMSGALEKTCLIGEVVTCVREPLGNDIARPVVDRAEQLQVEFDQMTARVSEFEEILLSLHCTDCSISGYHHNGELASITDVFGDFTEAAALREGK